MHGKARDGSEPGRGRAWARLGIAGPVVLAGLLLATGAAFVGRGLAKDTSGMWDFVRGEGERQLQAETHPEPTHDDLVVHGRPHAAKHAARTAGPGDRAVCVRLCDGYFFPMGDAQSAGTGEESICAGLCPGAPTHVYFLPSDDGGIAGAVSRDRRPYSALPVALRYTKAVDNTCSCKRSIEPRAVLAALTQDRTLRAGDIVMTPKGLLVFDGSGRLPYQRANFMTLTEAAGRIGNAALTQLESVARLPSQDAGEMTAQAPAATPPRPLTPVASRSN